ncbi:MAG: hypothetical protein LBE82_00150 [Chitinophagaceae bacterium]|nr:hypothetical protein [Chitinophagaceae bacterium]
MLLHLTQSEMAEQAGIRQKDVSLLEAGKRAFIPTSYISFICKMGIDLNSIFDDTVTTTKRSEDKAEEKKIHSGMTEQLLSAKDDIIRLQKDNMQQKDEKIRQLQMELEGALNSKRGTHSTKTLS